MRKEVEEAESPKHSIRDSGYIDCWDSERSDSLSPPRHGREDSFDSLDSFGSRSHQTPSPDVLVARGSSDGRGSDSESDGPPQRKTPDIRKDDMLARRTSVTELRTAMPFNQYLPNKSNQSGYVPMPLRKKRSEKEDGGRKSWSTATSPVGGDRPFSPNQVCSLVVAPTKSPTPSSELHMQVQTAIEEERNQPSSIPCIEIHAVGARRSSEPLTLNLHQPQTEPPRNTQLMVTSEHSTTSRSCSEELFHHSTALTMNEAAASTTATEDTALRKDVADALGDDKWVGRRPTSPKHVTNPSTSDFLPLPAVMATASTETSDTSQRKERALSERDEWRETTPWSDRSLQVKSMSMIDMRGEEEAVLQPHSQARHELMHNQYNRMKEEEDHWQDDLARWKNRRRSISQDLIKKEEERKMMEQLMSGGSCVSQRRRSIKTYREIVEDKERREEELRLAYRSARTPEDASAILQRYAQRFSISEAVLERLQLPKLLDRSVSADPAFPFSSNPLSLSLSASPTTPDPFDMDPDGPLRYLRQQSTPAPKFTSTLEARIEEFPKDSSSHHRPQIRSRSSEPPSTRALSPKPVPLLTPKPYTSRPESWNSKGDGLLRVNGDIDDVPITPEGRGRESPHSQASPSKSTSGSGDGASSASFSSPATLPPAEQGSPVSTKTEERQRGTSAASEDKQETSTPPTRPTSLPTELQKLEESFGKRGAEEGQTNLTERRPSAEAKQGQTRTEPQSEKVIQSGIGTHQGRVSCSDETSQTAATPLTSSVASSVGLHPNTDFEMSVRSPLSASNPQLRWEFFAASETPDKDPCENKKYQREQEKLREEWEKAQREVAEEERKYHEEERRILEETVAPLTPRSSAFPSPSRGELSTSEPHDTIVRSLADWERKQELLEMQSKPSVESVEWKRRENDRTSDISTADDSMKTGRSLMSMSSSQAEAAGHSLQNGQKLPLVASTSSPPVKKQQEVSGDSNKPSRPPGERRCCSSDNNMGRSPCRPHTASSEPPVPNRSVSGKKLCSSCGQPLGKGAAMIIETLSLYFHIHCFKCGVCKGQLGDTTTGTDVRIRNGLLNCHQCYIRSRSAGQPTTL